jgi:dCMP deaminase
MGIREGRRTKQIIKMTSPDKVPEWDDYFLEMCEVVSARSKDPSTKHGAVLVDEKHRIVSTGYNGASRKIPDYLLDWGRPAKYNWGIIHAEENALWTAERRDLDGCTLYVTGRPCCRCMMRIIHLGVSRIVCNDRRSHCVDEEDWKNSLMLAELAKIELIQKR